MKLDELQAKLIAVARRRPSADHVPYAFEKRVMARLASTVPPNIWALWGRPLWRAALSCVAITVLCGLWTFSTGPSPEPASITFSQDFEAAVFAPFNEHLEGAW